MARHSWLSDSRPLLPAARRPRRESDEAISVPELRAAACISRTRAANAAGLSLGYLPRREAIHRAPTARQRGRSAGAEVWRALADMEALPAIAPMPPTMCATGSFRPPHRTCYCAACRHNHDDSGPVAAGKSALGGASLEVSEAPAVLHAVSAAAAGRDAGGKPGRPRLPISRRCRTGSTRQS